MIKVGLIGCGFMGAMHANCYNNINGVSVTAFADVRKEKAEELAKDTKAEIYGDGKELIEKADVDVIDICLPTFLHAEYALLAMDKVKYLFVEKPVALTNEQAAAMIEKSEKTGGKYGKVINANFRRLSPRPDWGWKDWLLDNKLT